MLFFLQVRNADMIILGMQRHVLAQARHAPQARGNGRRKVGLESLIFTISTFATDIIARLNDWYAGVSSHFSSEIVHPSKCMHIIVNNISNVKFISLLIYLLWFIIYFQ